MNVIIDTSVWSEFFRRKKAVKSESVEVLKMLIRDGRAVMPGIVKQELLSGIREEDRFEKLRRLLSGFKCLLATEEDHIHAASLFNSCKKAGVQGSFGDFLICAQAQRNAMSILTSDNDFVEFSKIIAVNIWKE